MLERSITYTDFIRWALAEADEPELNGDTGQWHRFVFAAKHRCFFISRFFKYVVFDTRVPDQPHSDQADHVRHVLIQTGLVTLGMRGNKPVLIMNPEQRATALKGKDDAQAEYRDEIAALAQLAKEYLAS